MSKTMLKNILKDVTFARNQVTAVLTTDRTLADELFGENARSDLASATHRTIVRLHANSVKLWAKAKPGPEEALTWVLKDRAGALRNISASVIRADFQDQLDYIEATAKTLQGRE